MTWRRRGSGIRIGFSEALFELGYRLSGASKADGDALSLRQKRCHGPAADKANWIRTLMAVTIQDLIAVFAKRPNSYGKRVGDQLDSFNWLVFRHRRRSTVSSLKIDDRVSVQTAPPKSTRARTTGSRRSTNILAISVEPGANVRISEHVVVKWIQPP